MKFLRFPTFPTRFRTGTAAADLRQVQQQIEQALDAAGLGQHAQTASPLQGALEAFRQGFGFTGSPTDHPPTSATTGRHDDRAVIDVVAREVGRAPATGPDAPVTSDTPGTPVGSGAPVAPAVPDASIPDAAPGAGGTLDGRYTGPAGSRSYRVYLPSERPNAGALPMIVMLHGCTQSPDDFAAGTRMNALAERDGFIVVYPAQSQNANGSRCWNWFRSQDQARDGGEPALIAGIVGQVAASQPVDPSRIYAAGLSAGGAMAVILGQTYPELFAAIGVHSGLAFGAAHDVSSAFAAMGGDPRAAARPAPNAAFVPTIVFHGDRDSTVSAGNGTEVIAQAIARSARSAPGAPLRESVETDTAPGGQRYTRTVHADAAGQPRVERWELHGAGHAWSGGSNAGSYTNPAGPDASEAMLRFFKAQSL